MHGLGHIIAIIAGMGQAGACIAPCVPAWSLLAACARA
jgi:hypothetical protein